MDFTWILKQTNMTGWVVPFQPLFPNLCPHAPWFKLYHTPLRLSLLELALVAEVSNHHTEHIWISD